MIKKITLLHPCNSYKLNNQTSSKPNSKNYLKSDSVSFRANPSLEEAVKLSQNFGPMGGRASFKNLPGTEGLGHLTLAILCKPESGRSSIIVEHFVDTSNKGSIVVHTGSPEQVRNILSDPKTVSEKIRSKMRQFLLRKPEIIEF